MTDSDLEGLLKLESLKAEEAYEEELSPLFIVLIIAAIIMIPILIYFFAKNV
jgi:hypothetical protein